MPPLGKNPCLPRTCGPLFDNRIPFDWFPASRSNQITYEYFCLLGGLENYRCHKVQLGDGRCTYHKIDKP